MKTQTELQDQIWENILIERLSQDKKWGYPREYLSSNDWTAILAEEVGEAAEAGLHLWSVGTMRNELKRELIQVAAVAVSRLEHLLAEEDDNVKTGE